MKYFFIAFRSELYKFRKSAITISTIVFPLLLAILIFCGSYFTNHQIIHPRTPQMAMTQWMQYLGRLLQILSSLMIPIFTIFIAFNVYELEYKSDTLKSMYALPLPKASIFIAKYVYAIWTLAKTLFWMYIFNCAVLHLLSALKPNTYSYTLIHGECFFALFMIRFFLAALGILSCQMLLSTLFKSFFPPMGIGLFCTIAGSAWAALKPATSYLFPYAAPNRAIAIESKQISIQSLKFPEVPIFTKEILFSLLFFIAFAIVGYFILQKKNIK